MLSTMESEAMPMSTQKEEALQALAAKGEVEHNLANLTHCPPLRHAAFGAIVAALVSMPALSLHLRFVALVLIFAAIFLVAQWDKRRLGVFINGYRRGKTRMVAIPMLVVILGLYYTSYYLSTLNKSPWINFALGAVAFVVSYVGSMIWQRVFVSELSV
jgi:hypothetical protein